jgi:hypothetical protein
MRIEVCRVITKSQLGSILHQQMLLSKFTIWKPEARGFHGALFDDDDQ